MKALRFLLFPFAIIYWVITSLRNAMYNAGIFKSSKFSVPIISVGNLSVGGTGKTPHVEYLIRLLADKKKTATLSRGYGRKEHGFKIADDSSTADTIGDEPMQFYHKYGDKVKVVVEPNRVRGVMDLMYQHNDTEVVLLDDAYQHRAINRGINILLTTHDEPYFSDMILPVGRLRECRSGVKRADIVIVTKCSDLESVNKDYFKNKINIKTKENLFFSTIKYGQVKAISTGDVIEDLSPKKVVLVTGIAKSDSLKKHITEKAEIVEHISFPDHHRFKPSDIDRIHSIFDNFAPSETVILTTEKDAMRLMNKSFKDQISQKPWYYQQIEIELDRPEEFDKIILDYVETNS